MFGNLNNPRAAYKTISLEATVAAASPHELILMLFDGASTAIGRARIHMANNQTAEKGMAISKAIDIVANGLKVSLDVKAGGEIAERLASLYDYICDRLFQANLKNDLAALDEAARLLGEIHDAWKAITPQAATTATAAA